MAIKPSARDLWVAFAVASPALVLAFLGPLHPATLSGETAARWRDLHVILLMLFPLLGIPLYWLLRGQPLVVRGTVAVLAFLYAVFYNALDAIAGVTAGAIASTPANVGGHPALRVVFDQGNALAKIGVWSFFLASLITSLVLLSRLGAAAAPGAVLLSAAAFSFLNSHIYWPRGVITLLVMAGGFAALSLASTIPPHRASAPTTATGQGSQPQHS